MASSPTKPMVIAPLRGMDQREQARPQSASFIQDMRWSEADGWEPMGGLERLVPDYTSEGATVSTYTGIGDIRALAWFSQHSGAIQWLLFETPDGAMRYFNGSTAPSSGHEFVRTDEGKLLNGLLSAGKRWQSSVASAGTQYAVWGDLLYMTNGKDPIAVFDGFKLSTAGYSQLPGEPTAAILDETYGAAHEAALSNIGLGVAEGACAYRWRVSFANERGNLSPPSNPSSTLQWDNPTGGKYAATVQIPLGPPGTTARYLWRTQVLVDSQGDAFVAPDAALYYLVTIIPDNITTTFLDLHRDIDLGPVLDESLFGPAPAGAVVMSSFKNRMFAATREGIYYSSGAPEQWPAGNFFPRLGNSTGAPTGLFPTRDALICTWRRGVALIRGTPASGFSLDVFDETIGNAAPNCLIQVPGLGLAMLGESGVYLLDGALNNTGTPTRLVHLSADIPELIAEINFGAIAEASATVNPNDKEVWFAVPTIGNTKPTRVLVYHYEVGAWSVREKMPVGRLTTSADHRQYVFIGSNDSARPGIMVYNHGFYGLSSSPGTAVTKPSPRYETANITGGNPFYGHRVRHVLCMLRGYGRNEVEVNYIANRAVDAAYASALSRAQLYAEETEANGKRTLAFYGSIILDGSSTWARHRLCYVRFDMTTQQQPLAHELRLVLTWTSAYRGRLAGLSIEFDGRGAPVLALNSRHGG